MASRTQLRLGQITGSFGNREGGIVDTEPVGESGDINNVLLHSGSLVGVLSHVASAMLRIHGHDNFANNSFSTLKDLDGNTRITYVADGKILLSGSGTGVDAAHLHAPEGGILLDVDKSSKKIHLDSAGGVDIDAGDVMTLDAENRLGITSNTGDIELLANATNKKVHIKSNMTNVGVGIHIDGNAGVNQVVDIDGGKVAIESSNTGADSMTLDSTGGVSIDAAAASNFTVATDADGEDLTIAVTGATESSVLISSTGTGTDAVKISASAGDIVIEAEANDHKVTIKGDHASGTAIHLDGDAAAASVVDIDAGILQIDAAGAAHLKSAEGVVALSGSSGADSVHIQSELTVTGKALFAGGIDVNGTVTTIDTLNVTVKDRLLGLNYDEGAEQALADAGLIIGNSGGNQKAFIWDNDQTQFALLDTTSGADATVVATTDYLNLRLGALVADDSITVTGLTNDQIVFPNVSGQLEGSADLTFDGSDLQLANGIGLVFSTDDAEKIESDGNDLTFSSGRHFVLNAGGATRGAINTGLGLSSNDLILSGGRNGGSLALDSNSSTIKLNQEGNLAGTIELNLNKETFTISGSQGNQLVLAAGKNRIDLDVEEQNLFSVQGALGESILSSSNGRQIILESNDGKVGVKNGTVPVGQPGQLFEIDVASNASATLLSVDGFRILSLDGAPNGKETLVVSGGANNAGLIDGVIQVKAGATNSGSIAFFDAGESHSVRLAAPALTSDVHFNLPSGDGSSGQFLTTDGNGQLSFASAAGGTVKGIKVLNSPVTAGTAVNFNAVSAGTAISGLSTAESQGKSLDVFVNGQLLVSGSEAERSQGARDFAISSATQLKFAFNLEIDDVIQVIKR